MRLSALIRDYLMHDDADNECSSNELFVVFHRPLAIIGQTGHLPDKLGLTNRNVAGCPVGSAQPANRLQW